MAEETRPTFEVTHQRITSLVMTPGEVNALVIAEVIRRATLKGIVVDLGKGTGTKADVLWRADKVIVEISEDLPPPDPAP